MLASVTRLIPRLGSYDDALVAYRSAQLRACVTHTHGVDTPAALSLRARALLRLGDPGAALSALEASAPRDSRDQGEVAMLLAVACSRLGDVERSDELFEAAVVHSISALDGILEAEVEFYRALTAFGHDDLAEARIACSRGLATASSVPLRRAYGPIPLAHVVSRIQELLGLIEAAEGDYESSLVNVRETLESLDRCAVPDVFQEAFALKNLTMFARDFDVEDDARMLMSRVPQLTWTDEIGAVKFTAFEALGWCAALRGHAVEALRLFRRAEIAAVSSPEKILVIVDRALMAREFGHHAMVVEEVEHALYLAERYDWETTAGDFRGALLTLAQAAASILPERARETLDRFTSIRNKMDGSFAARLEPRVRAEESYTHGLVLRAEGRIPASAERLQSAFTTWQSIGYEWRAGRAALELAELDAGDVFKLALRSELTRRPNSVFSARARLVA